MKILVIDDSAVIRRLLSDFFTDVGYDVEAPEDLDAALQLALTGEFDVCICDLHMPKRSGLDVYQTVNLQQPALQFIMTDSVFDDAVEKARAAGVRYCLRKPFDLTQMREVIEKIRQTVKQT